MLSKNRKKKLLIFLLLIFIVFFSVLIERTTLPETTDEMHHHAIQFDEDNVPAKPFVYDGCTFFVDSLVFSDFTYACLKHDIAYWRGGTEEEREIADKKLRNDLRECGLFGKVVAYPAYVAVRLFGDSFLTRSVNAHWGFGWEEEEE